MTDLDLLVMGAMVTFLAVAGAYVAIRHRANESPVESFKPLEPAQKGPVRWHTDAADSQTALTVQPGSRLN